MIGCEMEREAQSLQTPNFKMTLSAHGVSTIGLELRNYGLLIHRLKGELLLASSGAQNRPDAERCVRRAGEIAH